MPDRQNRGGRWLQRTADRGPEYPEPEWQYIPPDPDDSPGDSAEQIIDVAGRPAGRRSWPGPELPNGRVLIHIDDDTDLAAPIEQETPGPD